MRTKAKVIKVQIKHASLARNIRYMWVPPYLIVPLGSAENYIKDAIKRFEERSGLRAK